MLVVGQLCGSSYGRRAPREPAAWRHHSHCSADNHCCLGLYERDRMFAVTGHHSREYKCLRTCCMVPI